MTEDAPAQLNSQLTFRGDTLMDSAGRPITREAAILIAKGATHG